MITYEVLEMCAWWMIAIGIWRLGSILKNKKKINIDKNMKTKNIEHITCSSKEDTMDLVDKLSASIEKYGKVTVADLYDLVGSNHATYEDYYYGWSNLKGISIRREDGKYVLHLPRTIYLK